jgi:hypothetical protein
MTLVVELLLGKCAALSPTPRTTKKIKFLDLKINDSHSD